MKQCPKHGKLSASDLIKKGKLASGKQAFRCKKCQKELHAANYKKNKTKINAKAKKYKQDHVELAREWRNAYYAKTKDKNRENKRTSDRKSNRKRVEEMSDTYMKHLIQKETKLAYGTIPESLINLKRSLVMVRKRISLERKLSKEEKLSETKRLYY
jgi:transposase-like protein